MDPARMFLENLTPSPELENNQGQKAKWRHTNRMSASPLIATGIAGTL